MARLTKNVPMMLGGFAAAVFAGALYSSTASAAEGGGGKVDTQIKCDAGGKNCKVSEDLFVGWRTFNGNCLRCHGADAGGSTFAPSLYDRMKEMPQVAFEAVVKNGLKGSVGVMPAFGNDGNVTPYLGELYAYLHALTTKQIPAGRPAEMEGSGEEVPEYLREKQGK